MYAPPETPGGHTDRFKIARTRVLSYNTASLTPDDNTTIRRFITRTAAALS